MQYLLTVAVVAEKRGVGLMSWSRDVQDALWRIRQGFTEPSSRPPSELPLRRNAEATLGHLIVEKHLPMLTDDAPFEELLRMREFRAEELEAFRVALADLATQVDLTQTRKETFNVQLVVRALP